MDGITEPVVLVLGHPIAGNPSQFAIQRVIHSMQLPWRVLSCDVPADQVDQAIAGAGVLGFRALLLDRNLIDTSMDSDDPSASSQHDFYFRKDRGSPDWDSQDLLHSWLEQAVKDHFHKRDTPIGTLLSIGMEHPSAPYQLAEQQIQTPIAWASAESIEQAQWILLTEPVDADHWPESNDHTLVLDLANPSNDVALIQSRGYRVLSHEEARVGVLMQCLRQLTESEPPLEVLQEAIEEYLAV